MMTGCASAPPVQIGPITSQTASEEWVKLSKVSEGVAALRAYANVRIESTNLRRSFNAKISVDRFGSVLIEALTPLGTSAFSLYSHNESITFVNHVDSTYWEGSATDLAGDDAQLKMLTAVVTQLPFALMGLPEPFALGQQCDAPRPEVACMETTGAKFIVTPAGVREVSSTAFETSVLASFDPPAFPPQHASIVVNATSGRSSRIEIDYRDVEPSKREVREPRIPRTYRCCVAPAVK